MYGTFLNPFAASSPWNTRPINPTFGSYVIPVSSYFPTVAEGAYSLTCFNAKITDPPMVIHDAMNADTEKRAPVVIPRWPADVTVASGTDKHADIVDEFTGIIHSFHKLQFVDGKWSASLYSWTRIDGRGWGDPGHYYQGARAAGVPSMGGLIRKHEVNDGKPFYEHALAISLDYSSLGTSPTYVYPATSADHDAALRNKGQIPEGALLMLPPDFDENKITNLALRKVVCTLKLYGGYVVDRNIGTPYVIYVENGSGFKLQPDVWDKQTAEDLQTVRACLRVVTNQPTDNSSLNLLSMRGDWGAGAYFDSWQQAVVFANPSKALKLTNPFNRGMQTVSWSTPKAGESMAFRPRCTGGACIRFQLVPRTGGAPVIDSLFLPDNGLHTFQWPDVPVRLILRADAPAQVSCMPATASATLIRV